MVGFGLNPEKILVAEPVAAAAKLRRRARPEHPAARSDNAIGRIRCQALHVLSPLQDRLPCRPLPRRKQLPIFGAKRRREPSRRPSLAE